MAIQVKVKDKLSAVGLPLVTLLVTAGLGVVWAIAHKTRLEAYYTDLAYRTLADLGDAIGQRVFQHDLAFFNAKGAYTVQGLRTGGVPDHWSLVYHMDGSKAALDLRNVVSQLQTDFFDDIILCDNKSNVLYQKSQYGRRLVTCSSISHSGQSDTKKEKETGSAWVLPTDENPFRVFEHRILLEHPNTDVALGNLPPDPALYLTVLGLVRQQRLESEVLAFPFTLSLAFVFIVCLAFFSIPMVRVLMLRPHQRLRRWDGAWLTVSTCLTASLITYGLLSMVYFVWDARQGIDRRLTEIAGQVERNAREEFYAQRQVLARAMVEATNLCREQGADSTAGVCPDREKEPAGKLRKLVSDDYQPSLGIDPSTLDVVVFTGRNGQQVSKWTMKAGAPTTLISVSNREFFRAVDENRTWLLHDPELNEVEPAFLEALVSRTTAENVVVQSMPGPPRVLSITSRPSSLFGVFVQPGFGFTIIDRSGEILFHSQQERNLRENLFDDCMEPAELKSAVNGRSVRTVDVNYLGRDHRFHITPLRSFVGSPWTLVTFYDREHLRSAFAGVVTVTFVLHLGYTLLAVVTLVILVTFGFLKNVSVSGFANPIVLLWPHEETRGGYRGLIVWLAGLLAVEAIALVVLPPLALTCVVAIMPLIALMASRGLSGVFQWDRIPGIRRLSFQWRYTIASALFLILATVVPCTAFFRTAYDYEMSLVARHEMAALMRHLRATKTSAFAERERGKEYIENRIASHTTLGVYSCAAVILKDGAKRQPESPECPFPLRHRWTRWLGSPVLSLGSWPAAVKEQFPGLYDAHAQDRFGAANSEDRRMDFAVDDAKLRLTANYDTYLPEIRAEPLFLVPSAGVFVGLAFIVGLIGTWMFLLNRRLFLFDIAKALSLSHHSPIPDLVECNLFVLVSPCDDQAMSWNQRLDLVEVDLAAHTGASAFEKAEANADGTVIVLNHFEDRIENPEVLEDRIQLIKKLTSKYGRRVVVISSVDPFYHISAGLADAATQERLTHLHAALAGFTHRTVFRGVSDSSTGVFRAHA